MRAPGSIGNPLISIDIKPDLDFADPDSGYATPELQHVRCYSMYYRMSQDPLTYFGNNVKIQTSLFDHMLAFKWRGTSSVQHYEDLHNNFVMGASRKMGHSPSHDGCMTGG